MTPIEANPTWSAVPQIEVGDRVRGGKDGPVNKLAQALANRTELLRSNQKRTSMMFATLADAEAAAATLPDGQELEVVVDETRDGRRARYKVDSGALSFQFLEDKKSSLFSRSKLIELSFRDTHYDYLKPIYHYGDLYPQSFCMDSESREIFILKSAAVGDNNWAWIWVHDMDTGAVKTVFTTGEGWRESLVYRKIGSDRYLYTISSTTSSVIRLKITTLPALYDTVSIDQRYAITNPALTFLAWDGQQWWVHSNRSMLGSSRRNFFYLYDSDFTQLLTKIELPRDAFGDFNSSITNSFVKSQGITAHAGSIYSVVGGVYVTGMPEGPNRPINQQGIFKISPYSEIEDFALCHPVGFIEGMSALTGYTNTLCEPEGCCSDGKNLFALWVTLDPSIREDAEWLGKGIVICHEDSKSVDAVDFCKYSTIQKTPFNGTRFQSTSHHGTTQLLNPITGEELNSFERIINMMIALGLSEYKYSGSNQTLTDINGNPVVITGRQVCFSNANGTTVIIDITGAGLVNARYVVSGLEVQVGPVWDGAEIGSNATGTYAKHSSGHLECWYVEETGTVCGTTSGALWRTTNGITWVYPHAFLAGTTPTVTGNPCNGGRLWGGTTGLPTATHAMPLFFSTSNDSVARPYQLHAVGRWK